MMIHDTQATYSVAVQFTLRDGQREASLCVNVTPSRRIVYLVYCQYGSIVIDETTNAHIAVTGHNANAVIDAVHAMKMELYHSKVKNPVGYEMAVTVDEYNIIIDRLCARLPTLLYAIDGYADMPKAERKETYQVNFPAGA